MKTGFAGSVEQEALDVDLEKKKEAAEKAKKRIERPVSSGQSADTRATELTKRVKTIVSNIESKGVATAALPSIPTRTLGGKAANGAKDKTKYLTDGLSQYTRETRKVVGRIYDVINQTAPDIAEELISSIQNALNPKKE